MKIPSGKEMSILDGRAINEIGIPSSVLMENAGRAVSDAVLEELPENGAGEILIVCGTGNNGGDGMVAARHLHNSGLNPQVFLLGEGAGLHGDAELNLKIAVNSGITVREVRSGRDLALLRKAIGSAFLIVDAIFGTGLSRTVEGRERAAIEEINRSGARVVSVDIPSGLDADTGKIKGVCIDADLTVTMALPKRGLLLFPGAAHAGEIQVADIGIPRFLLEDPEIRFNLIEPSSLDAYLPERPLNAHKGDCGRVLLLAGSPGLTGAAALAGQAALRIGSGPVTLGIPRSLNAAMEAKLTEVMTLPLPENSAGTLSAECLEIILEKLPAFDVLAAGPGLGRNPDITSLIGGLLSSSRIPTILDADALAALAHLPRRKAGCPLVLTPHPGEMALMTGKSIGEIVENPLREALEAAAAFRAVVVLKGAHTIAATPDRDAFLNTSGNSGMATAGMGDVLTGMITGLAAQKMPLKEAALAAVHLHGAAGDLAFERIGSRGFLAGDLLAIIPEVLEIFKGGNTYAR
jgi:NAD(P)H-hydrate epimerase